MGEALALEIRPGESPATDSAAGARERPAPRPGLDRSWISGDTVRALFTAAVSDTTAADSLAAAGDTVAPARDTAATELERLLAIGNARSFYRIRRDGAETAGPGGPDTPPGEGGGEEGRMARNYVIGDRITIRFRDGDPLSVHGTRAIGLFLEPVEGEGNTGPPDSAAAPDTAATAPDTVSGETVAPETPPRDSAVPDTTAGPLEGGTESGRGTLVPIPGIRRPGGMIYE